MYGPATGRQRHGGQQQPRHRPAHCKARGARVGSAATMSGAARASDNGPARAARSGRTTSTAKPSPANTSTSVTLGSTATPNACSSPISSAARYAPGRLPRPAHHHHHERIGDDGQVNLPGLADADGRASAPPSPASAAPSANTPVNNRRWSTPRAATISRSSVAARTSVPQRVRVNSSHSSPRTSGPTPISSRSYSGNRVTPRCQPRTAEPPRPRQRQVVRPPQAQHGVLHHQHDAERGQQLEQLRRAVDAAQQQHLQQHAHRPRHQRRPQHAQRRTIAGSRGSRVRMDQAA